MYLLASSSTVLDLVSVPDRRETGAEVYEVE